MKAIMTEFLDGSKIIRIECHDENGKHIFDALWDPSEQNTPEGRTAFRDWTLTMLKRKGYTIE